MNIEYVGRNVQASESLQEFSEDKLGKVLKFIEEPIEVRVTLEVEKHRKIAELHIAHRFGVLQAKEETDDLKSSIGQAVDKIEKQARRSRKKFFDRRRRQAREGERTWPLEVFDPSTVDHDDGPRIVKSSTIRIEDMDLNAAIEALGRSEHDFVVFRDLDSGLVSVLYKRRDEHYGLISPEA